MTNSPVNARNNSTAQDGYTSPLAQSHKIRDDALRKLGAVMPTNTEDQLQLLHQHTLTMFRSQEKTANDEIRNLKQRLDDSLKQSAMLQKRLTQSESICQELRTEKALAHEELRQARDQIKRLQSQNSVLEKVRMAVLTSVQNPDVIRDTDLYPMPVSVQHGENVKDPISEPATNSRSRAAEPPEVLIEAKSVFAAVKGQITENKWRKLLHVIEALNYQQINPSEAIQGAKEILVPDCPTELVRQFCVMIGEYTGTQRDLMRDAC